MVVQGHVEGWRKNGHQIHAPTVQAGVHLVRVALVKEGRCIIWWTLVKWQFQVSYLQDWKHVRTFYWTVEGWAAFWEQCQMKLSITYLVALAALDYIRLVLSWIEAAFSPNTQGCMNSLALYVPCLFGWQGYNNGNWALSIICYWFHALTAVSVVHVCDTMAKYKSIDARVSLLLHCFAVNVH